MPDNWTKVNINGLRNQIAVTHNAARRRSDILHSKLEVIDARTDATDTKVDLMTLELDRVYAKLDAISATVNTMNAKVQSRDGNFKKIDDAFGVVNEKLNDKFNTLMETVIPIRSEVHETKNVMVGVNMAVNNLGTGIITPKDSSIFFNESLPTKENYQILNKNTTYTINLDALDNYFEDIIYKTFRVEITTAPGVYDKSSYSRGSHVFTVTTSSEEYKVLQVWVDVIQYAENGGIQINPPKTIGNIFFTSDVTYTV